MGSLPPFWGSPWMHGGTAVSDEPSNSEVNLSSSYRNCVTAAPEVVW